jgi:DNA-binding PadR family transcriptional regulator
MDRELKRGTLDMVLLRLLSEREMYGYELVAAVEERTGGALEVAGGTMYPVLYRLEQAGYVEPRWQTPERGAARKYYRLTPEGTRELERLVTEWRAFIRTLDRVLEPEGAPHE